MAAIIFVPTPLRKVTGGQGKIEVSGSTLAEALENANQEYPGFKERVLDSSGEIKRFINVFVNGVDVRKLKGQATPVKDGDEVAVIPAMAGGQEAPYPVLVDVKWLTEHIQDPHVRILDVRVSDPRLPMGYRMGHNPNAIPFDLGRDVYEMGHGLPKMKPPESIAATLAQRGISNDSQIVLYDESSGPLAGFVFWLLNYLGHDGVHVLNGGWHAWQQAKGPITRDVPSYPPASFQARTDPSRRVDADWVIQCDSNPNIVLLDARSDAEYYMGHIPHAVNLSFDAAIEYPTQRIKSADELRQQFESIGVTPDKEIVTYCGSGSRSAHSYLVLKSLGYPRVRNYDGSMMDWERRGLPIE